MSINATHNGNNVISYYPLPNISDLLASWHNCKIFSSLDLGSGHHHLMPEAKPKTAFTTTSREMTLECGPIWNMFSTRCILLLKVTSITALDFCFAYVDDISIYSTSWKEHLQHLETIFNKCQFFKQHLYYQGHLISEKGIQSLPDKIITIKNLAIPKNFCVDFSFCCFAINSIDFSLKQNITRLVRQAFLPSLSDQFSNVLFQRKNKLD